MGMTIDKAILRIEHSWMSDDDKETADFIINIMHKYQKIEQILDDCDLEAWEVLEEVKEVVEDGNDEQRENT